MPRLKLVSNLKVFMGTVAAASAILMAAYLIANISSGPSPEQIVNSSTLPDTTDVFVRCNRGRLETRLGVDGAIMNPWGAVQNASCTPDTPREALTPAEALRVKLMDSAVCPPQCICPDTRTLDSAILRLGACQGDLKKCRENTTSPTSGK